MRSDRQDLAGEPFAAASVAVPRARFAHIQRQYGRVFTDFRGMLFRYFYIGNVDALLILEKIVFDDVQAFQDYRFIVYRVLNAGEGFARVAVKKRHDAPAQS